MYNMCNIYRALDTLIIYIRGNSILIFDYLIISIRQQL